MLETLSRRAVLGPCVLVIGYIVYRLFFKPRRFRDLPVIGTKDGDWFPTLQASWRNTKDFKSAMNEAHTQYGDRAVYIPSAMEGLVLLPAADTQWVSEQPENVLGMHEQVLRSLQTNYTIMDPYLADNPVHHKIITTTLTNQIGNLVPDVAEETEWGFEQHWGDDTAEWREVCVYDSVRRILGNVTNRVFVGSPLCRNQTLLDNGIAYAQDVPLTSRVLQLFPSLVRPLVAPLLTWGCRVHTRAFYRVMRPEIERRLRDFDARAAHAAAASATDPEKKGAALASLPPPPPPPPNDFLQWSIAQAKASGDPYMWHADTLAGRVLLLNFAAVHTSSFSLTAALFDVVTTRPEYLEELREEIRTQLAEHGSDGEGDERQKRWNKRALAKMEKLDSFLRESMRMNSFVTLGLSRIVTAPRGVTTPSGTHLPRDALIFVPAYSVQHDSAVYPDAESFRPFRFAEQRHEPGVEYVQRARQAFPTTSPKFLSFGHGKNACPGRFFAANELKLMLAHAIMNYDFEPLVDRPPSLWFGFTMVPPMKATIRIRKRKDAM